MSFWESFAGGAGQGAGAGLFSGFYNDQMRTAADHSMDRADNSMREQMAYGERMSNTAHQREVEDLRKAGLNPILSATGGPGASGGAPGSGTGGVMPQLENVGQKVISNAVEGARMSAQLENIQKNNELLEAQKNKVNQETKILKPSGFLGDKIEQMYQHAASKLKEWSDDAGWSGKEEQRQQLWKNQPKVQLKGK